MLHWQATVLVLTVAALGVPLGIAAGRIVYRAYIDRLGVRTDLAVPYGMLAVAVLGLLLMVNLAALVPAHRVRRALPASALADE